MTKRISLVKNKLKEYGHAPKMCVCVYAFKYVAYL